MEEFAPGTAMSRLAHRPWLLTIAGVVGIVAAFAASPVSARAAASQVWPAFVLVVGLLLIGLVADDDGLFEFIGHRLATTAPNGLVLFFWATLLIGLVTALLNLDTSVAFLTPVLIYSARSRGGGEAPLLFGCILLSNAGSLFLPGSNLTNLIVLSHLRLTGREFLSVMWEPALAALVVTALVIVIAQRRELHLRTSARRAPEQRPVVGLGLVGVIVATH